MEVVVQSTLSSVQGQVVIATDPGHTVDSLISAFCVDKGIRHHRRYLLQNRDLQPLTNHKTLAACSVSDGEVLYLTMKESNSELWCCGCSQWWIIAAVALLIGCGGLVAITILQVQQTRTLYDYGVVIDAGSTHSQIFVYKWAGGKNNGTAIPDQIFSNSTAPGISSYEYDPRQAGASLAPLLHQATGGVPSGDVASTLVYMGATAGMRLLNASDKPLSDQILNSTQTAISASGFYVTDPHKQARILEGREEGAYSWVTVNYLLQVFTHASSFSSYLPVFAAFTPPTTGALDLGGASTQITFIPETELSENSSDVQILRMYGTKYKVYTHSYLCYGVNEALRQYWAELVKGSNFSETVNDPCRPSGNSKNLTYSEVFEAPCTLNKTGNETAKTKTFELRGTSDDVGCMLAVDAIFNFSCDSPPCGFDGISQPLVHGQFLAFSGYYYTMEFLNLTSPEHPSVLLADFERQYIQLCQKTWQQVSVIPIKKEDRAKLPEYCFMASYIQALLVKGYKFTENTFPNIQFLKKVNNNDLGWSLGYMLNASNSIPESVPQERISLTVFILLVILFSVFLIIAVCFSYQACSSKKKQAQYQKMTSYGSV